MDALNSALWPILGVAAHPLGVQITGRALAPRWQAGQAIHLALPNQLLPLTALTFAPAPDIWEIYLPAGHPLAGLAPGDAVPARAPVGKPLVWPLPPFRLLVDAPDLVRVWPLIRTALARRTDVAVLWPPDQPLPDLPAEIEMHRRPATPELRAWADIVLLDAADTPHITAPRNAWALATPPMPCGVGACQACGVRLGHHHHLACQTGPVIAPPTR